MYAEKKKVIENKKIHGKKQKTNSDLNIYRVKLGY